jgi:Domain of unknown function (DUF4395)
MVDVSLRSSAPDTSGVHARPGHPGVGAASTGAPSRFWSFPNPVNEVSARLVAGGVVAQGIAFLVLRQWWVLVPLTYGFLARVLTGPKLSPLGQFVTRVVTPRLSVPAKLVPGPPKRFAQLIGLSFTAAASI